MMGTKVYDNALDLITFSRASGGTAMRKVSYGSELVTNGTFDTDSDWTKGAGWTISGGVASNDGTINAIHQSKAIEAGKLYACTIDITFNSPGVAYWRLGDITNLGVMSFDITSYTQYLIGSADGNYIGIFTNANITIDNISVKEVFFDQPDGTLTLFNHPNNIPRIEYAADGTVKGLLIEEQRTNLVTYSEAFDNPAWAKNATTATFNTLTAASDGTFRYTYVARTVNSGDTLTLSVWAKANTSSYVWLLGQTSGDCFGLFNLSSGTYLPQPFGAAPDSGSIQAMGDGWYRCSITFTKTTASGTEQIGFGLSDSGTTSVTAGASVYLKYAQLEAGSFATSYIPTSGSTATRSADIASIPVSAFGYNQKAGTVVVEQSTFNDVKNAVVWQIDDGTSNNRYVFNAFNGNTTVLKGVVLQASLTHTGQDVNVRYRHGFGYKLNSFASVYDGGGPVTDATGTLPTVSTLRFGSDTTPNAIINGHIKSIQYYPRRLTNTQLQELTA